MINAGLKLICKLGLVLHSQDLRFSEFFIEFIHHLLSSVMATKKCWNLKKRSETFFSKHFFSGTRNLTEKQKSINPNKHTPVNVYFLMEKSPPPSVGKTKVSLNESRVGWSLNQQNTVSQRFYPVRNTDMVVLHTSMP